MLIHYVGLVGESSSILHDQAQKGNLLGRLLSNYASVPANNNLKSRLRARNNSVQMQAVSVTRFSRLAEHRG